MKRAFILFVFLIMIYTNVYAKYVIDYTVIAFDIKIDTILPEIKLINVINNSQFIKITIEVNERNIKQNNFNKNNIVIYSGTAKIDEKQFEINESLKKQDSIIYIINLNKNFDAKDIKLEIKKDAIIDISNNGNEYKIFKII